MKWRKIVGRAARLADVEYLADDIPSNADFQEQLIEIQNDAKNRHNHWMRYTSEKKEKPNPIHKAVKFIAVFYNQLMWSRLFNTCCYKKLTATKNWVRLQSFKYKKFQSFCNVKWLKNLPLNKMRQRKQSDITINNAEYVLWKQTSAVQFHGVPECRWWRKDLWLKGRFIGPFWRGFQPRKDFVQFCSRETWMTQH